MAHINLPKIVAYLSLRRWSHALRSDQKNKNNGLPKLLRWSDALRSDKFVCPRKRHLTRTGVDVGPTGGSSVRRTGSGTPIGASRN